MVITEWQAGLLADLHYHWGDAYHISTDGDVWSASPVTDLTVVLTAESADDLRRQIRSDYGHRTSVQAKPRPHDQAGRCWCGDHHK